MVTNSLSTHDSVLDARLEDACGMGTPVHDHLRSRLITATRHPNNPFVSRCHRLLDELDIPTIERVAIHSNADVSRLSRELGFVAFCWEKRIFVNETLAASSDDHLRTILAHELTHLQHSIDATRVRGWGGEGHSHLSDLAVQQFVPHFEELYSRKSMKIKWYDFTKTIRSEANGRDHEGRLCHPIRTFRYGLGGFLAYNLPAVGLVLQLLSHLSDELQRQGLRPELTIFSKGEGPEHGEGTNYVFPEVERNQKLNIAVENLEIQELVRICQTKVGDDFNDELLEHLGKLLHTTQDRASHREGRRGYGHNDPRGLHGWEADNQKVCNHDAGKRPEPGTSWWICSVAAYNKAFNNSCEVLERFFRAVQSPVPFVWVPYPTECNLNLECRLIAPEPFDNFTVTNLRIPGGITSDHHGTVLGRINAYH